MVAPTSYFAKGEKISEDKLSSEVFSDGVLAELAAQTGDASKERLMEIARTAYFRWSFCMDSIYIPFFTVTSTELFQSRTAEQNFEKKLCAIALFPLPITSD